MNNAEFARQDRVFGVACGLAGTKKTKRQASKFRNGTGAAIKFRGQAKTSIKEHDRAKREAEAEDKVGAEALLEKAGLSGLGS